MGSIPKFASELLGERSLSRIGSTLSKPLFADDFPATQSRISYARLLIVVDVTKPKKEFMLIEDPDGIQVEQKVVYDWFPPFCATCNLVGHDCGVLQKPHQRGRMYKQQWVPKKVQKQVDTVVPANQQPQGETWATVTRGTMARPAATTSAATISVSNTYDLLHKEDPVLEAINGGDIFPSVVP